MNIVVLYRVAPVMTDLLVVLEHLDSRETVVNPDLVEPLEPLVPPVLLDPLVLLVDLETVERL